MSGLAKMVLPLCTRVRIWALLAQLSDSFVTNGSTQLSWISVDGLHSKWRSSPAIIVWSRLLLLEHPDDVARFTTDCESRNIILLIVEGDPHD